MSVQNRIKRIGEYFKSMNVAPDTVGAFITYVEVVFPKSWMIIETTRENFNIDFAPSETPGGYFFWSADENAEDRIFDAIEANIKVNKDAEEKVALLMKKIEELKSIFSEDTMDLETLKTLEFKFSKPKTNKTALPNEIQTKRDSQTKNTETKEENNE